MFHFTKKRAVVLAVVGSLAVSAGAYAYFTSTGTGSGSATVGTSSAFVIAANAPSGGPLTPGGTTEQTIAYSVTNPSSGRQNLAKVTVRVANSNGTAWEPTNADGSLWTQTNGCSAADFRVNGAPAGDPYEDTENARNLTAGEVVNNTVTIKMVNRDANQDACKDTAPPLYLAAS